MTGYIRQDTSNNIANGNIINADDLDLEFNTLEEAFNSSTGHAHDGTSGDGAPILTVGPAQDIVTTSVQMAPKTSNTYDLGSAVSKWKDLFVDGVAYIDAINLNGTAITSTAAELNILDGATLTVTELNYVDGVTSSIQSQLNTKAPSASPAFTGIPTAPTAVAGTNTTQLATTAHVFAERTNTTTLTNKTLTNPDINGGTIDGAIIGGSSAAAITGTTITATGDVNISDKIVHTGDTNTSIRFPSADTVTVETSGVERFRVNSTGNVGIGTSTPTAKLDVSGNISSSGNISLVASTTEDRKITLGQDRTSNGNSYLDLVGDSTYTLFGLRMIRGNTGPNTDSTIQHRGTGQLNLLATEAGSVATYTSGLKRMVVVSNGNVGIGVSNPVEKLDVVGNVKVTGAISGTAVTQSVTDTTSGRLLKVGDFGLGSSSAPGLANLDSFSTPVGVYSFNNSTGSGTLPQTTTIADTVLVLRPTANQTTQIYSVPNNGLTYIRKSFASTSWGPWRIMYDSGNLLGTVSQSSGVPTGAVIERGSNVNGEYIRFADGTQICWKDAIISSSVAADTYSEVTWTYPALFVNLPTPRAFARSFNDAPGREVAARNLVSMSGAIGSSTGSVGVLNKNGSTTITARVDGFIIGRWF
jgi:hypothetical protein